MKKTTKIITCAMMAFTTVGLVGCGCGDGCMGMGNDGTKITVWVSEADRAFATQVADEFKKANPDKKYNIVIDAQGVNDVATRVLKDVENAADIVHNFMFQFIGHSLCPGRKNKIRGPDLR